MDEWGYGKFAGYPAEYQPANITLSSGTRGVRGTLWDGFCAQHHPELFLTSAKAEPALYKRPRKSHAMSDSWKRGSTAVLVGHKWELSLVHLWLLSKKNENGD